MDGQIDRQTDRQMDIELDGEIARDRQMATGIDRKTN